MTNLAFIDRTGRRAAADITVNNSRQDPLEVIRELADGLGANVAIEAVGVQPGPALMIALAGPCHTRL